MTPFEHLYFLHLDPDPDPADCAVSGVEGLGFYWDLDPEAWKAVSRLIFLGSPRTRVGKFRRCKSNRRTYKWTQVSPSWSQSKVRRGNGHPRLWSGCAPYKNIVWTACSGLYRAGYRDAVLGSSSYIINTRNEFVIACSASCSLPKYSL